MSRRHHARRERASVSLNLGRWARAAAAVLFALAPAFAQTAPDDGAADPGLRGGDAPAALPSDSPADALPDLAQTPPRPAPTPKVRSSRKRGDLPPLQPYRGADRLGLKGGADLADPLPPPPANHRSASPAAAAANYQARGQAIRPGRPVCRQPQAHALHRRGRRLRQQSIRRGRSAPRARRSRPRKSASACNRTGAATN